MKINKYLFLLLLFAIQIKAQSILFFDDFSSGSLTNWSIKDDSPPYSGPSTWSVQDGVLRQTSNIWAYSGQDEFVYHMGTHIVRGDESWINYSFNAKVKSLDDDGIGLVFRYSDAKNYYRFILLQDKNNGGPFQRLQVVENGKPKTIFEVKNEKSIPTDWFVMTIDVRNDSITGFINAEQIFKVQDATYTSGKIGMMCYANAGAHFDSISVTKEKHIYSKPITSTVYVDRAPYIQMPEETSCIIAWVSKNKQRGKVEYGLTNSYGTVVDEDSLSNRHAVKLNNLKPNTKYFYRVVVDNVALSEGSYFFTAKPSSKKEVSFLIFGDSGVGNQTQYKVAGLMEKHIDQIDFLLHVGDVSQSNGQEYDDIFYKPYKNIVAKKNVYLAVGNHDTYYDQAETYLREFILPSNNAQNSERYYSFSWGNVFFICFDSNIDYLPGSAQYKFMEAELNSEKRKSTDWTVIYFHHPPYCELWDTWDGEADVRNYLHPMFKKYNVDFVFNGHTHGYERGELDGVNYIITGGGGGGLDTYGRNWQHISKSIAAHHYTKVDITENTLNLTAVDIDEKVIDKLSIYKSIADVENQTDVIIPHFSLEQNYPNPFNPTTKIRFNLSANSLVKLDVYNSIGQLVRNILNKEMPKGSHEVDFDGKELSSGVYFYKISAGKYFEEKKMIIIK